MMMKKFVFLFFFSSGFLFAEAEGAVSSAGCPGRPPPICQKAESATSCEDAYLKTLCSAESESDSDSGITEGALSESEQSLLSIAGTLAGRLTGISTVDEIMQTSCHKAINNCQGAHKIAKLSCEKPIEALGGRVTQALNVIGKAAAGGMAMGQMTGSKSINELCKAMAVLSGTGVTISMLAKRKCSFYIKKCQHTCQKSIDKFCDKYRSTKFACQGCSPSPPLCTPPFFALIGQQSCRAKEMSKLKTECEGFKQNTASMMIDIGQMLLTLQGALTCKKKTDGDDPETEGACSEECYKRGGQCVEDIVTGSKGCSLPPCADGKNQTLKKPCDCDKCPNDQQCCAGKKQCQMLCADGSCNYPNCGCNNCPGEDHACENGKCRKLFCTDKNFKFPNCSPTSCPNTHVYSADQEKCVTRQGDTERTCRNRQGNYPNCGCGNCPPNHACDRDSGVCRALTCTDPSMAYPNCGCNNCPAEAPCPPGRNICVFEFCKDGSNPPCACDQCPDSQSCKSEDSTCTSNRCSSNTECGTGKECRLGECKVLCENDSNCPEGKKCSAGVCKTSCTNSNDCADHETCTEENICEPECTDHDDCSDGQCVEGVCRSACSRDANCAEDQVCLRGACIPNIRVTDPNAGGGGGNPTDTDNPYAIGNTDGLGSGNEETKKPEEGFFGKLPFFNNKKSKKAGSSAGGGSESGNSSGGGGLFGSLFGGGSKKAGLAQDKETSSNNFKGAGGGGFGGYGKGGRRKGSSYSLTKLRNKRGAKKQLSAKNADGKGKRNIGLIHQNIFYNVSRRYKALNLR